MTQAIRRAIPQDIPAMVRIVYDWERATGYISNTPPPETLETLFTEAFPKREMYVTGDPVDGYMSFDPATGYLGALFLTKPGQGTGKRLLDLAKQGRDHLWLTVYEPNTNAIRFYQREGFTYTETQPPDEGAAAVHRMDWTRPGISK